MGPIILALLTVVALAYGAFTLVLYFRQRALQYSPTHKDREGRGGGKFKPWRSSKGELLGYYRPANWPRRLVVFFHGSGGEALDRSWVGDIVPEKDLLILAEYPGYGGRPGSISEQVLVEDAKKLVQQAKKTWGELPVLAVGESLGCSVAAKLASTGDVDRLALITPFASGEEMAAKRYRFLPVKWLMKDKYRTAECLGSAKAPLHVVHGTLDEYVPLDQAKAVYQAYAGTQKTFEEVPGFGHSLTEALLHSPFTSRFRQFIAE